MKQNPEKIQTIWPINLEQKGKIIRWGQDSLFINGVRKIGQIHAEI